MNMQFVPVALLLLCAGCVEHVAPTAPHPFVYPEIADRATNVGATTELSIAATLNDNPEAYSAELESLARSARVVTFPELQPIDGTLRREVPTSGTDVADFRIVWTPASPLTDRWYAIEMPASTSTIDVKTSSGETADASGPHYVRFRPDSFPIARELLLPEGRDRQTVYVQISEPVTWVDGALSIRSATGEIQCVRIANTAPVSGSPFTLGFDCDPIPAAAQVTLRFMQPLPSVSSGAPMHNVGDATAPLEFTFVPAALERRGNVPTFVFPD